MLLSPPSESEQAAIRAAHAHRFPQSLTVQLIGDGGAPVTAHLLIGNPSGCRLAPNTPPPPADPWRTFLATVLRRTPEPATFHADLCADMVLWPNPAIEWPQIMARWPGVVGRIANQLLVKVGGSDDMRRPVGGLSFAYKPPRGGAVHTFTVEPPDAMRWQIFMDAVRDERGDLWRTLSEMVAACVRMDDLDATIARWPGFAIQAFTAINRIAGGAAEVEMGE